MRSLGVVVLAFLLPLSGCEARVGKDAAVVRADSTGAVAVEYASCHPTAVLGMGITTEDGTILWQVEFPEGHGPHVVAVGSTPPGGVVTVPLAGALDPSAHLLGWVHGEVSDVEAPFRVADLVDGRVAYAHQVLDQDRFVAESSCEGY